MLRAVVARLARIDILVNNAAISDKKNILDTSEAEWDASSLSPSRASSSWPSTSLRNGGAGHGGRIVQYRLDLGFYGGSPRIAYSAAKGGVANLTLAMAVSLPRTASG